MTVLLTLLAALGARNRLANLFAAESAVGEPTGGPASGGVKGHESRRTDVPASDKTKPTSLPVSGVVVEREPFVLSVQGTGRTQSLRRAQLSLRVAERVATVHVRAGDFVRTGQPLVELDRRPFEIALEEALARVANAEIDFEMQLFGDEDVPEEKRAKVAHRSGLTEARQQLERAQLDLDGTILRAPFDGAVAEVLVTPGERLQSNQSLVTVVDLDRLRLPVEVLENDFGRLEPGASASIRLPALPDLDVRGEIVSLAPELDTERGTGIAYIEIDNPDGRIKPGMYAEVRIDAEVLDDRIAVPREAVLERDRRLLVFRAHDGRAEWTYVETGVETDEGIEIRSGLAPGDTVLVDGHLTLAHGAPLKVRLQRSGL
ncbi:MAG: efflux RND transporter periplasmic adaptor subunit [Candidatus Latescibacterota bacterium]|nr:MAG: efflux RND transporter periplasmic adaptor subunit [Candidatus Latescibacterota bacterium]